MNHSIKERGESICQRAATPSARKRGYKALVWPIESLSPHRFVLHYPATHHTVAHPYACAIRSSLFASRRPDDIPLQIPQLVRGRDRLRIKFDHKLVRPKPITLKPFHRAVTATFDSVPDLTENQCSAERWQNRKSAQQNALAMGLGGQNVSKDGPEGKPHLTRVPGGMALSALPSALAASIASRMPAARCRSNRSFSRSLASRSAANQQQSLYQHPWKLKAAVGLACVGLVTVLHRVRLFLLHL